MSENLVDKIREYRKVGVSLVEISQLVGKSIGCVLNLTRRHNIKNYCRKCGKELNNPQLRICPSCKEKAEKEKHKVYKKICPICETPFKTHRKNQRYCSKECYEASQSRSFIKKDSRDNYLKRGLGMVSDDGTEMISYSFSIKQFPTHGDLSLSKITLGTGNLGPKPEEDPEEELKKIRAELKRLGLRT